MAETTEWTPEAVGDVVTATTRAIVESLEGAPVTVHLGIGESLIGLVVGQLAGNGHAAVAYDILGVLIEKAQQTRTLIEQAADGTQETVPA